MLVRLVRTFVSPYRPWLLTIVALQFIGTVGMLYLPSLNADIIDRAWSTATPATSCATAA